MLHPTTWCSLAVIVNLIVPTFAEVSVQRRTHSTRSQLSSRDNIPAISLGSASTYSVFASTGIATVPGTVAAGQIVTGDIGVGPIAITAITGFGAVSNGPSSTPFVTGSTYGPPTTGPPKVALAVLTAYNTAYGLQASAANSGLPTNYLDTVGTLKTPGVYKWAGTIVLGVNAILTIDGKCGDVYVFQAAGAISTGAGSQIVLTGGLTAATVYWAGATSLTTGVGSVFAGIILTGTNVVIAGSLVGGVYSQTEVALHQATIGLPVVGLSATVNNGGNICANCPPGSGFVAGVCTACIAPLASAGGLAPCARCSGAQVVNSQGVCAASAGTLAVDPNTGYATICSPGYFATGTSLACSLCVAGFYSTGGSVSSSNACTACSIGTSSCDPINGAAIKCLIGFALNSSTKQCNACVSGTVGLDGYSCSTCPGGKFSTSSASSVCTQCTLGSTTCTSSSVSTSCVAGFGVSSSTTPGLLCTQCSSGTGSSGGYTSCTTCSREDTGTVQKGATASYVCQGSLYKITGYRGGDTNVYYLQTTRDQYREAMFSTDADTAMLIQSPSSFSPSSPISLTATSSWAGTYFNIAVASNNKSPLFNTNTGNQGYLTQCANDNPSSSPFTSATETIFGGVINSCESNVWLIDPMQTQGFPLRLSVLDTSNTASTCLKLYGVGSVTFLSCANYGNPIYQLYLTLA